MTNIDISMAWRDPFRQRWVTHKASVGSIDVVLYSSSASKLLESDLSDHIVPTWLMLSKATGIIICNVMSNA